ncbi:MAG: ribonuclease Z [Nanoarchaeota archaeon]|nr:ribonuclease Z [Nanoarchaeota archaeon]
MVEKINITFLGTGSSIPTSRRNHPATLLQYKAENILIDCGEGTQRQFRKAKLNPGKVSKILISHWHGDHILGLPGLLQTMVLNGRNEKLEIYGPRGTKRKLKELMDVFMKWYFDLNKRLGRGFEIVAHEVSEGVFFDDKDFYIEATTGVDHGVSAAAYSFNVKEKNRLDKEKLEKLNIPNSPLIGELSKGKTVEINGKKVDGKKLIYKEDSRKVAIIMDTRYNEDIVKFAKGADLLITEASHAKEEQEFATECGHMTSVDAAKVAKKAKVKALVLVHLSQRYEAAPKIILNEARTVFEDVIIPEDLESVEL